MTAGPFESDASRAPERVAALPEALGRWRRELATVGGPNTLLWYAGHEASGLDLTTAHPGGVSMLLAGRATRLSDLVREREAYADACTRAAAIRQRAADLIARRGLETLFLVAGMATWEHPGGHAVPHAPVLLRRCALDPIETGGTGGSGGSGGAGGSGGTVGDVDVVLGDEVELNPVLVEYLRTAAGITVDSGSLAEMSLLSTGFDPYPVYATLARLCEGLPGFSVAPRLLVGTFPHGKLAMVQDLADLSGEASLDRLGTHTVLSSLAWAESRVGGEDGATHAAVEPATDLDPDPDPASERLVLDADAGQQAVVAAVRRGEDVAVHAPGGTGTTQTVANLVAALAAEGSSVLLVAEQRSEIADVQDRLAGVGLGDLVFDAAGSLFDHRGTLERALAAAQGGDPVGESRPSDLSRLREDRDVLRDHVAALHEVRPPWGVTLHQAQGAIAELAARPAPPESRVRLRGAVLARLSRDRLHELALELSAAAVHGAWAGEAGDPWYGAAITTTKDVNRARDIVERLAGGELDAQAATLDAILAESSLPPARTAADWATTLTTMAGVRETLEVFRPEVFDSPLDEHVAATGSRQYRESHGVDLGWANRNRVRRLATRLLRPGTPPDDLHAELVRARSQRAAWNALVGAGGRPEISPRLDEAQATFDALRADLDWLEVRLAPTRAGGELSAVPLDALRRRLGDLAAHPERLAVLPDVVPLLDDLRAAGLGDVVDDFAHRGVAADEVEAELDHIWWVSVVRQVADADPRYGQHDGTTLRTAAESYRRHDREHLEATTRAVAAERAGAHTEALVAHRTALAGWAREVERPTRPPALRTALERAPDLLPVVAPCWAMTPLLVAETVPPGPWFDVAVVVGAATVTPAVAMSALSRARQLVAVGDLAGSGPTSFDTSQGPAAFVPAGGSPRSLLSSLADVVPTYELRWGHGFADSRLVSAAGGAVVSAPSVVSSSPVRLELVDGRAEVEPGVDAAIETTAAEAARVAELVSEYAGSGSGSGSASGSGRSVGVLTLTERHADHVRSLLPPSVPVLVMGAAGGRSFDVVVLSVGYGKTRHGRVLHRFPSLTSPGWREGLTTAVTAARRELVVVSSIGPEELDPLRLKDGAVVLQELLRYAWGSVGDSADGSVWGSAKDSAEDLAGDSAVADPLLDDLAVRLRREGLIVRAGVGAGTAVVDLAVTDRAHAGRWLVGVLGDGVAYASWRGTRDRDRLWPEALERRGWRPVRVWSTDLFRDPAREVSRVVAAVREAGRDVAPTDEPVEPLERVEPVEGTDPAEPGQTDLDEGRTPDPGQDDPDPAGIKQGETVMDTTGGTPDPDQDEPGPAGLEQGEPAAETTGGTPDPGQDDPGPAGPEQSETATETMEGPVAGEPETADTSSTASMADQPGSGPSSSAPSSSADRPPSTASARGGRRRLWRRASRAGTADRATGRAVDADPSAQTSDDTAAGWGERPASDGRDQQHDRWLEEQRPPHWE